MSQAPNNSDPAEASATVEETTSFTPKFDDKGLIPAIVIDQQTNDVAMFAWMNQEALTATQKTGVAHFWSRSRKKIWCKGEESGNLLRVQKLRTDCDQDCIVVNAIVEGDGVACHTKRKTCFYRELGPIAQDRYVKLSFAVT